MLRFLATVFGCVHDLEQTALMLERQRGELYVKASGRLDQIFVLKDDLTATRKARDEQMALNLDLEVDAAKFRALWEATSLRAVRAESEAAYYRGIVGSVRRAMERDRPVPTPVEARVHPEQRAPQMGKIAPWDDEAKAQYDSAARANLR